VQHIITTLWGLTKWNFLKTISIPPQWAFWSNQQKKEQGISTARSEASEAFLSPLAQWIFDPLKDDMHPICKPVGFWWLARTLVQQTLFEISNTVVKKIKYMTIALPSFL
jgi:hypothetical protein